jgi:hypothetical protein
MTCIACLLACSGWLLWRCFSNGGNRSGAPINELQFASLAPLAAIIIRSNIEN